MDSHQSVDTYTLFHVPQTLREKHDGTTVGVNKDPSHNVKRSNLPIFRKTFLYNHDVKYGSFWFLILIDGVKGDVQF